MRSFFKALELSRFLLVRGLWLILVDLTLIKFGWRLEVDLHRLTAGLATFGQVPFFYYVVHIYLIHALAVATGFAMTGTLTSTSAIGFSLPGVYFVWLLVLVILYPICSWFAELKESGKGWWWSYL